MVNGGPGPSRRVVSDVKGGPGRGRESLLWKGALDFRVDLDRVQGG